MPVRTGRARGVRVGRRRVLPLPTLFLLLAACLTLCACFPAAQGKTLPKEDKDKPPKQPNIVFILTDDLAARDLNHNTLKHMPNLMKLMEKGTTFDNAFVTNALCCPSRATALRGQYTHNDQILSNNPPLGGFQKFHYLGRENSTVATWLDGAGYRTALVGKYLNGYSGTYIPPGWDDWHAINGNFLSNDLSENGRIASYDPDHYYLDDLLSEKASDFTRSAAGPAPPFFTTKRPFFLYLATNAPHQPATPAPRDENAYPDLKLPHPPDFDEKNVSDKPEWIKDNPPLSPEQKGYMKELHRKRLQSMLAVDDMIGKLVKALKARGALSNTYIFFTSDHGFHLGEHRLGAGKWTAYEEDIRVPLIVRGPGVPEGKTREQLVLNNDLAPTFADLAGAKTPAFVDGRSLVPLLKDHPPPPKDWRKRFVVESVAERGGAPEPPLIDESTFAPLLTGDPLPNDWRRTSVGSAKASREWGRPWMKALRTENYLYVQYKTGEHELYDLRKDPYELHNEYATAPPDLKQKLEKQLDALRKCKAQQCRTAEGS
jgi:N-acetylglucosamine-6-sulfatase